MQPKRFLRSITTILVAFQIYGCCFSRLRSSDIDQEVKERAISCMGRVVANLCDHMSEDLPVSLPILLERLRNEITRLTAVKALARVAASPLMASSDLGAVLEADGAIQVLASFLRKNQRALKLATLLLLDTLAKRQLGRPNLNLTPALAELPPLVSESDLHIAQLAMHLMASAVASASKGRGGEPATAVVLSSGLPEVLRLAQSPLLQGAALNAMLNFFEALVASPATAATNVTRAALLERLVQPHVDQKGATIHKQVRAYFYWRFVAKRKNHI